MRDIFKDGPSPKLQAVWDAAEATLKAYNAEQDPAKRAAMLEADAALCRTVTCEECRHVEWPCVL